MEEAGRRWKLAIHGPSIDFNSNVPMLDDAIEALLGAFADEARLDAPVSLRGETRCYDADDLLPRLSESATHVARTFDMIDIYEDRSDYWMVDDRWGMARISPAESRWISWIIPNPRIDVYRLAELSVMWPMAQLLGSRGVHLLPAASVVRDGFAALILSGFGIEPELTAMICNGYKLIGQRWTALREDDGRIALLQMPGRIERSGWPRLRIGSEPQQTWVDLTEEHPGSRQSHAFCDAVIVAAEGRRPRAHLRETPARDALQLLRNNWPLIELGSARPARPLATLLAETCRCSEIQFSRNSNDLLALLNSMRYPNSATGDQSLAA